MLENSTQKQRGFQPGRSGNPAGKPPGTKHRATRMVEALLEGEAEAIGRKCVEKALEGDATALRLVMERIAPVRKGRPVQFDLPAADNAADLAQSLGAVLRATAAGALTPDEAALIAQVLDRRRAAIELVEIEGRLARLEEAMQR